MRKKNAVTLAVVHTHTLIVLKKIRKFRYIAKLNLVDN